MFGFRFKASQTGLTKGHRHDHAEKLAFGRRRPSHPSASALRRHGPLRHRLFCQLFPLLPPGHRGVPRASGLPPEETFKNVKEGFGLPIVEACGRFRRPSRYGDLLGIETRIQEMRPKAEMFHFESYPETGRDLLAEGTATLVAIGPEWRARDLPERIKSLVSETMKPGFKQTS